MVDAKALLEAIPDPLVVADADERILDLNPAAERLLVWRAADLRGQPLSTVLPQRTEGHAPAVRKDGNQIEIDLTLSRQGALSVAVLRQIPAQNPPAGSEAELHRLRLRE